MKTEKKKIALFRCCMTSMGLSQYETTSNAVLRELGIEFAEMKEFNCCGYPLKNLNFNAYLLSSARNLALAERAGLDLLTVCNCCYGSLKYAEHVMEEFPQTREAINASLQNEGLRFEGGVSVKHLLGVLHTDFGIDFIRKRLKKDLGGLRVAVHYGCHLLRPSKVVGFDNGTPPVKFDALVEALGAQIIPWMGKDDCCGSPVLGVNDELSMDLTEKKLRNAHQGGADCLMVVCPYCQMQFGKIQNRLIETRNFDTPVPCVGYPQLLGLCLGIDIDKLWIEGELPAVVSAHLRDIVEKPPTGPHELQVNPEMELHAR
ncbi:MAG: CoB--CoM heterodisulfide reductase iron-sulfur subunit B family protein [Syntrophobacteraceae bacterium]|jgi:heterodisulfide reductase subunit B